jgi:hypothetical protein
VEWARAPPLTAAPAIRAVRLTAALRSVLTELTEKKKFAAKSSVKSRSDGNPKTGKTVLAVTSRLRPPTVKENGRRWRLS